MSQADSEWEPTVANIKEVQARYMALNQIVDALVIGRIAARVQELENEVEDLDAAREAAEVQVSHYKMEVEDLQLQLESYEYEMGYLIDPADCD